MILTHQWLNKGVAPCYESYALQFTLHDQTDQVVASQVCFPDVPTTQWRVNTSIDIHTVIRIPAGLSADGYRLKVAMVLPEHPHSRIQLGISGKDDQGRYVLCEIPAVESRSGEADVVQEGFEQNHEHWYAGQGITLTRDQQQCHSGTASLRVEGTQSKGWNYAGSRLAVPVFPGSKYRLSCWMKVDQLQPDSLPPYLKLGISNAEGEWVENSTTEKYDLRRAGEWQQLCATAETSLHAAKGQFAIERGTRDTQTAARIWLDDVQLRMLEGP